MKKSELRETYAKNILLAMVNYERGTYNLPPVTELTHDEATAHLAELLEVVLMTMMEGNLIVLDS
jgi:hypothetical protein